MLALAGCRADRQGERSLITDPQFAVGHSGDSLASLYEMDNPNRLPGRYIVRFKPDVADSEALAEQIALGHGGRVYEVLRSLSGFWGELPETAIEGLRRNPSIRYIEADVAVPVTSVGDTTQWNPRWPLDRVDQRSMPLNGAYEYSVVGRGVRIWIIDTGVSRYESDLAGRIDESWYVTNNGKDPYAPCYDHGTPVARAAAGTTNGVAKQATIHSARVDVDCTNGDMSTGAASFAFEFIGDHSPRPAVANFSAGLECSWWGCGPTMEDAAKYARSKGVTVIVSAGNEGRDACGFAPARTPELLTVGASDANDQRHVHPEWSSNYGSCLDLFAPVEYAGATSLAAPLVSGVAALHLQLYPSASPSSVESAILSKTTNGVLSNIGAGSPNRLLYSKQPPLLASILGPDIIGQQTSCTWNVQPTGGQPPYSHEWRRDGVVVGHTTSYSVSGGQTSAFMLEVVTTDGVGRTHWAAKHISIDPNNFDRRCLW